MSTITTGKISTRPGARVHLAIDGRIADNGRRIIHTNQPGKVDTSNLCRRCFTPARVAAAQQALTNATGATAQATRAMLDRIAELVESPAGRAAMDDLAARIVADLAARQAAEACAQAPEKCQPTTREQRRAALQRILDQRAPRQLSGLGRLAAAHRTAHAA